ncbi:CTP synthase [Pumilibacter intestinalis]|uniref:CTP synthase n=1 Tax=Pumilibacter intestinalis TaxID=2941511 RepID=UPI003B847526
MIKKYIFVTGGVVSGLGKGITAASIGMMLKAKGLKVIAQKLDPYINMDPGTMSPYQHGEVFVTEDGAETDLDLGHYERFIDENLNKYSNLTTGKVYWNVLDNERKGVYNGETVQVIPHITNEIKKFIYSVGKKINADVVITEIGGTTGDIESLPFLEAIRQVSNEAGRENCLFIHVTLAPVISSSGEMKTKPTQHSVKELQSLGITPNLVVLRCSRPIDEAARKKISMFCNVPPDCVIENRDVSILYEAPIMLEDSKFTEIVSRELGLPDNPPDLTVWKEMLVKAHSRNKTVTIGLVGKYVKMYDAYLSIVEALTHAGIENGAKIDLKWLDAERITPETAKEILGECDGIILPGGFGDRGIEGMVNAARYCRENDVPYFGICLGMQIAVIDFARHVAGLADANSREFDMESQNKVIDIMEGQIGYENTGGSMRLGAYECKIKEGSILSRAYKQASVMERHRHRYEFNNAYREKFDELGLDIVGTSPDNTLVEAVEVRGKKFHLGVQYHPEFKSRPHRPHPLFVQFIAASLKNKKQEN